MHQAAIGQFHNALNHARWRSDETTASFYPGAQREAIQYRYRRLSMHAGIKYNHVSRTAALLAPDLMQLMYTTELRRKSPVFETHCHLWIAKEQPETGLLAQ